MTKFGAAASVRERQTKLGAVKTSSAMLRREQDEIGEQNRSEMSVEMLWTSREFSTPEPAGNPDAELSGYVAATVILGNLPSLHFPLSEPEQWNFNWRAKSQTPSEIAKTESRKLPEHQSSTIN